MARKRERHPLYVLFILLMCLMLAGGVALLISGSASSGVPAPRLPGITPLALLKGWFHG